MRTAVSCCVVMMLCAMVSATPAQNMPASFSVSISTDQANAKLGDPLVLAIDLKNLSNSTFHFRHTGTDQAETIFDIEMRDSLGNVAPFTRYCKALKGIDQGPGPTLVLTHSIGYASVEPQQSFKVTSDLSKCFDMHPGVYSVQASFIDATSNKTKTVISNKIALTIIK